MRRAVGCKKLRGFGRRAHRGDYEFLVRRGTGLRRVRRIARLFLLIFRLGLGLLLYFLVRELWFETPAAPRLVHPARSNHDQFFRRNQALRVHSRIPAPHANGKQLGDFFGHGKQARDRLKRPAP